MTPEIIRERIQTNIKGSQVVMSGEDCNFSIQVISELFINKSPVQRHRMVNDLFKEEFNSGALHALSIKTLVPKSD